MTNTSGQTVGGEFPGEFPGGDFPWAVGSVGGSPHLHGEVEDKLKVKGTAQVRHSKSINNKNTSRKKL